MCGARQKAGGVTVAGIYLLLWMWGCAITITACWIIEAGLCVVGVLDPVVPYSRTLSVAAGIWAVVILVTASMAVWLWPMQNIQ
jgi:hypothetical protein